MIHETKLIAIGPRYREEFERHLNEAVIDYQGQGFVVEIQFTTYEGFQALVIARRPS